MMMLRILSGRIKSIRQFLMLSLCLVMGLVMSVAAWFIYRDSVHETDEVFDARLAQYARLLSSTAVGNRIGYIPVPDKNSVLIGHKYEVKISFQIWKSVGHLLAASDNASSEALGDFKQGYQDRHFNDGHWRVFVLQNQETQDWVMVAEQYDARLELVRSIAGDVAYMALLGTVIALIFMAWILKLGFKPLDSIAAEIIQRREDDLTPVLPDKVPEEVKVLVDNINALLLRVRASLERERRFTADAAHELKTPLAALKLQLENFRVIARAEDLHLLDKMQQGMNGMQRVAEQLLVLNRLHPQYFLQYLSTVYLLPLCRAVLSQEADIALQKHQDLFLETDDENIELKSDHAVLQILLRNLLHNAVIYTPVGGSIALRLSSVQSDSNPGVMLDLTDTGPGIPADEREKVFERFYRVGSDSHASGETGSGLGLAIVQEIVALHGGTIKLEDGEGGKGLRVRVFLPAQPRSERPAPMPNTINPKYTRETSV
jgi:two-component system sensor histidine kinase QseC